MLFGAARAETPHGDQRRTQATQPCRPGLGRMKEFPQS